MIPRRRFLALSAAFLAARPAASAAPLTWTGRALGAEARVTLSGASPDRARAAFRDVERALAQAESRWSLFRDSELTRLNRTGILARPSPAVRDLFALATRLHAATGGAFDPSVQPLWLAHATGTDPAAARRHIGWERVQVGEEAIRLQPGMALTFNGLAQGAAADAVAAALAARGFGGLLIDTGEIVARGVRPDGGPWRAAIAFPDGTEAARTALSDTALATSSPAGTRVGGVGHILDPRPGAPGPRWALAAIAAPSAAVADGLSTACCLLPRPEINHALNAFAGARLIALAAKYPDPTIP